MKNSKLYFPLFAAVAMLFFACGNNPDTPDTPPAQTDTTDLSMNVENPPEETVIKTKEKEDPVPASTPPPKKASFNKAWMPASETKLKRWFGWYGTRLDGFSAKDFVQQDTFLDMDFPAIEIGMVDAAFQPYFFPSPNGKRQLDIYSYNRTLKTDKKGKPKLTSNSPDSEVALLDAAKGERTRLIFCGTPCRFEDAAWLNNEVVVVAGYSEGNQQKAYPTLWYIHLKDESVFRYLFSTPLEKDKDAYMGSVVFASK